jgi:hypothetical protein
MKKNILFNKEKFFVIFLFLFSLLINQYYANFGVSPHDSFSHFDSGYRILLGDHPFKDYWIISGPLVDYIQALFFFIFGVNWVVYVLHASFFNAFLTLATFFFLRSFEVKLFESFIFSLFFSVLAYPSSGTPFVDHHSAFFLLLGIYSLLLAIKNDNFIYWTLLPIFFIFAFLSKQVPTVYVGVSVFFVLIFYSITQNKYKWILISFLSALILLIFLVIFGYSFGIEASNFFEQYISYPQTIGERRFQNYNVTFNGLILHFKFIYLALALLSYNFFKRNFSLNNFYKKKDFIYFLTIILFTFSLILHQILTKNQTFIFFLIPIIFALSYVRVNFKKSLSLLLIFSCFLITTKYHLRFNEERKFHDLKQVNFNLSLKANVIDVKLNGLKWITPENFKNNPAEEMNLLKETKNYLLSDKKNFMLLTNYSFFSSILEKKTYSTTRWHTGDGTDYPRDKNHYFDSYKNLFIKSINKNNIENIYIIHPVNTSEVYRYINESCFFKKEINKLLTVLKTKKECNELK